MPVRPESMVATDALAKDGADTKEGDPSRRAGLLGCEQRRGGRARAPRRGGHSSGRLDSRFFAIVGWAPPVFPPCLQAAAKRSRDRTGRASAVLRQLGAWRSPATVQQVGTALWRLANSLLPLGGQPELSCLCPGCRRPALSEGEWHPPPRLRPGRLTSTTSSPSSWRSVGAVRASRST